MLLMVLYVRVVPPSTMYVAIVHGAPTKPNRAACPSIFCKQNIKVQKGELQVNRRFSSFISFPDRANETNKYVVII